MDRDLTAHFGAGAREAPQPTARRVQQAAPGSLPPRPVRTDDRAEFVAYAGTWRDPQYPVDDLEDGEVVEEWDEDEDNQDHGEGWDFIPLGGRR
ncbi:hypothetical protein ACFTWH_08510 [Streptomyces sp. NPDC057011]|uniref:hypothetical protein n=1 Tax=unclassified Streptomyces TaxID=2593676 RepID=UPI00362AC99E